MRLQGSIYVLFAFLAYSALHSALATRGVKSWVSDRFGSIGARYYRLIYNLLGGLTLLPILAMLAAYPGDELYRWSSPWLFLALSLQFIGALVILIGLLQTGVWSFLGLSSIISEADNKAEDLITTGLYASMRHPLYSGGLLILWFIPVMTTTLLTFNLAATLYLYIGSIFEERRLLAVYGDEYENYRHRVPRFIPRPAALFSR